MNIAVLHPGAMGISVAAALKTNQRDVYWVAEGRSTATRGRAESIGLKALSALADLSKMDAVISVCPPDAAQTLASQVIATGFQGIYLDANAIAPTTAKHIASRFGSNYVDGGIIGPPAHQAGTTRLYLSGAKAATVQEWFAGALLDSIVICGDTGAASALKMCYAAYTKGMAALVLAVRALAEAEGVTDALLSEWAVSQPGLEKRSELVARGTGPKAWRFTGEMEEIARSFTDAALPGEFHHAAAEIYRRLDSLKHTAAPTLDQALALLLEPDTNPGA